MIKALARTLIPSSFRLALYEARQRNWAHEAWQWCHDWIPDRIIHQQQFTKAFGRRGNFEHPTTFNEKLHWTSLHDRQPIQTQCADKYAVRQFVTDRGLGHILNPLYGVWDKPEDIEFDNIPATWAMKVNHGSGQNLFRRDTTHPPNVERVRKQLSVWLTRSEYWSSREWAYKDIPPRIICEALLTDAQGQAPPDYKFFCFGGEPAFIQVDTDRFTEHHRDLFDLDWKPMPFSFEFPSNGQPIERPVTLTHMIDAAQILSRGFPFVRVDFYSMGERIIFGEMTWYPEGGLGRFTPDTYDRVYGEKFVMPDIRREA